MRVAENQRYRQVNDKVAKAKDSNARSLDDVSTLKTIREISDNPVGMTRAIRYRDQIQSVEQHARNLDMAKGFMETAEQALTSMTDNLLRAKELSIAMASDTYNQSSREAAGREIRELIDEVILTGNSNYNGRFVFGGFRNQTPPVTEDGNFLGDDGKIFLEVSPGSFRPINIPARSLFTPTDEERDQGHFNMVHTLQNIYEGMMSNDKNAIQRGMTELEHHIEKVTSYQASYGGMSTSLGNIQSKLAKDADSAKGTLSEIEDADALKVMSDFKRTESILQSTLLASNKVLQPSLLNFLQ